GGGPRDGGHKLTFAALVRPAGSERRFSPRPADETPTRGGSFASMPGCAPRRAPPRSPRRSAGEAERLPALHGLGAVADLQLAIEAARVLLDRVRGEVKRRRDLAVRRPLRHEL